MALNEAQQREIRQKAIALFDAAGIAQTDDEKAHKLEIVDFGQNFYEIGIVMMTAVNTSRYCGRYILFFPGQSCAKHWHPDVDGERGKEETFRVLYGTVYTHVEGEPTANVQAKIPSGHEKYYEGMREIVLHPGKQYELMLGEKHWFQAGPEGAIAVEFSSSAKDDYDLNEDPALVGVKY